jgi:hypothetical protein
MNIKMKTITIILCIFLAIILSSGSCRKGGSCEEPADVNVSALTIDFKDELTNKYLYEQFNPSYNKDSLKIFDNLGNQFNVAFALKQIPNSPNAFYVAGTGPIYNYQTDQGSFNSEICKEFIIQYKHNEFDTLNVCFKSKSTKCGSVFEVLKVFHAGVLVGSNTNNIGIVITVYKN